MRRTVHLVAWALVLTTTVLVGCKSAWVSSGLIYREQQGDYAKAEEMFKRAIDRSRGTEAIAFYELANTLVYRVENEHLANGEIDSARIKMKLAHDSYMKAAELEPEEYRFDPDAETEEERRVVETAIQSAYARMFNGAVQRMNSGRIDEAITWFDIAYLADPRGASGFEAALLRNQLRYNQVVDEGGTDPDPERLLAILADLDQLEVDSEWEASAEKKAELVNAKARILRGLGRESEATALYEGMLADDPNNIELLQQVARARQAEGEYVPSARLYERAFEAALDDPERDDDLRFEMGYFAMNGYVRGESYENVLRMVERTRQFADTNERRSRLARAKARAHYELEEYEQAVAAIEPVVQDGGYDPNNIEAWQIYYLALNQAGRVEESQAARERFVALRDGTS
ncbi:MAG TPA: hypothetical protein VKA86_18275 [Candidatus Krumholzibacteria bacterium]|nr:hypothetical protein [Candidatus Krumholzibacteria bacterium]